MIQFTVVKEKYTEHLLYRILIPIMEYITSHPLVGTKILYYPIYGCRRILKIAQNSSLWDTSCFKARQTKKGLLSDELTKYDFEFISNYNSTLTRGIIGYCLG